MAQVATVGEPAAATQAPSDSISRSTLGWGVLGLALLVALYAPTVQWLFERWTISVWHNAHGMFVPPLVAYLIYGELRQFRGAPIAGSAWGFLFLVPALLLHALDAGMHTQLASAVALIVSLPGLSLLVLGVPRTRAIAFPLLFLVFAIPIPLGMTEQLHLVLRHVTTTATASMLPFFNIPVYVEGTTLHMATGALEVADACSGFSTLYAAAAVACFTAYTASTNMRRGLVLLAAAPLAIAANILRVTLLVLLVVWQGEGILETFIHPLSGMMTFALALPVILWLGGPAHQEARA